MKRLLLFTFLHFSIFTFSFAQSETTSITLRTNEAKDVVNKEIYGQFAEHLGTCIYGGLWVGPQSDIPNTDGYRNDVLQALRDLKLPVMRWPGGCFADEYHWMDGIGPQEQRPRMVNNNWGGTVEDNSFGTHEFLNLCELLGCEPYVSMNVGSGSVEEAAKWVEYMTAQDGPMAQLRKTNGREKPWKVKYIGIGNESWGCGGEMRIDYYADLYRRYATYCRNQGSNRLYKIASGASDYDYNWTEVAMRQIGHRMQGLSLHYYTCYTWNGSKGSATSFTPEQYYWAVAKCSTGLEEVLRKHIEIMDRHDPDCRVKLLVDEWGTWWDEEPGSVRGHLYQQNSMRDAIVAAYSLNLFHQYTRRIGMTNIAQVANVLQSMVLTRGNDMLLTPTYHVFRMFTPNMQAVNIPLDIQTATFTAEDERKGHAERQTPVVSASVTRSPDGTLNVNLANSHLTQYNRVSITLPDDCKKPLIANPVILTSASMTDHNTFDKPHTVEPAAFSGAKVKERKLIVDMPPMAIVTMQVK